MSDFANSIRPKTIKEIVGQKHIISLLEKIVKNKTLPSLILHGNPGIGKTTIAYALINELSLSFTYFNAACNSKKELEHALNNFDVIIIDEIHRLNKDKQDILLPSIEKNKINIIATTTENPFFTIIPALRSRTHILKLTSLNQEDILEGLKNIIIKYKWKINIEEKLLKEIAIISNGDFRYAINSLNLIYKLYKTKKITKEIIKEVIPNIKISSDKKGDNHYNLLSAFHKSLRGSDIDASLYYLIQLIDSGDLLGLERRMIMVAYEDIGFANPNVSLRVTTAIANAKRVGFPEARIILSFATIDLCKANKSNSAYVAINNAKENIIKHGIFKIPEYLKSPQAQNHSKKYDTYKYPHDYGGWVKQEYLPKELKNTKYYFKNKNDKI